MQDQVAAATGLRLHFLGFLARRHGKAEKKALRRPRAPLYPTQRLGSLQHLPTVQELTLGNRD